MTKITKFLNLLSAILEDRISTTVKTILLNLDVCFEQLLKSYELAKRNGCANNRILCVVERVISFLEFLSSLKYQVFLGDHLHLK